MDSQPDIIKMKRHNTVESMSHDLRELEHKITTLEHIYKVAKGDFLLYNARIKYEEKVAGKRKSTNPFAYHDRISLHHQDDNDFEGVDRRRMHYKNLMSSLSSSERQFSSGTKEFERSSNEILVTPLRSRRRNSTSTVEDLLVLHRKGHREHKSLQHALESIRERSSRSSCFAQRRNLNYTSRESLGFHKRNIDTREKLRDLCNRAEKIISKKGCFVESCS